MDGFLCALAVPTPQHLDSECNISLRSRLTPPPARQVDNYILRILMQRLNPRSVRSGCKLCTEKRETVCKNSKPNTGSKTKVQSVAGCPANRVTKCPIIPDMMLGRCSPLHAGRHRHYCDTNNTRTHCLSLVSTSMVQSAAGPAKHLPLVAATATDTRQANAIRSPGQYDHEPDGDNCKFVR